MQPSNRELTQKLVSSGTPQWNHQIGSSYPETYSGEELTLDNRLYLDYLNKNGKGLDSYPLTTSVAENQFAPAGGVVGFDLIDKYNLLRPCQPHMPPRQNQASYILDTKLATDEEICQVDVDMESARYAFDDFAATQESASNQNLLNVAMALGVGYLVYKWVTRT